MAKVQEVMSVVEKVEEPTEGMLDLTISIDSCDESFYDSYDLDSSNSEASSNCSYHSGSKKWVSSSEPESSDDDSDSENISTNKRAIFKRIFGMKKATSSSSTKDVKDAIDDQDKKSQGTKESSQELLISRNSSSESLVTEDSGYLGKFSQRKAVATKKGATSSWICEEYVPSSDEAKLRRSDVPKPKRKKISLEKRRLRAFKPFVSESYEKSLSNDTITELCYGLNVVMSLD